ncbi:MAG: Holliday junction branch migration protein RuvA [Candidatus Kapabacteria bacterium]|nr:Holliday junction branch migration protein RuvA [Candidatus Kapabacteria bacterium]
MIAQLTGLVAQKHGMDVVIDCHGVGYAVSIPLSTSDIVPAIGQSVTLLTIMVVREDAMQLYGFGTVPERDAFKLLTSIQGIGGRIALGILSSASLADLRNALVQGNLTFLQRLPGIGKKTAERLVVELREKFVGVVPDGGSTAVNQMSQIAEDAISALQALGYARAAAEKSVKTALSTNPEASSSSETLIRLALRQ